MRIGIFAAAGGVVVIVVDFTWGTAVAGNWGDSTKWVGLISPGSPGLESYTLNFNVGGTYTATNNLSAGFLLNRINFGGSTATLAGNSLVFSASGGTLPQVNQNSSAAVTISTNLTLAANTTIGGSGNGTVTVSGIISGGGTLTKTTSGNLTLSGVNTYSGGTTVNNGTLTVANKNGLGTGAVTLAAGTTYQHATFEGNSAAGALPNAIVLSGTGVVTFNIPFGQKDIWLSQPISGTGGIQVQGGQRALTLTGNNTFSGGVTLLDVGAISNDVYIAHANSLGTGDFQTRTTVADKGRLIPLTNLSSGVSNIFRIAPGATLNIFANGTNHLHLTGAMTELTTQSGKLHKSGTATLTLSGPAFGVNGGTTVMAGILAVNNAFSIGEGRVVVGVGGKLGLNYVGERGVASLSLGNFNRPAGTWGSTASSATNQNDTYFSGTGWLNVLA
jgi:autotransporter-associated beta strand protein